MLFLIRHGQASFGKADYDQLSELGCRQSEILGMYLAQNRVKFDLVFTGTKKRQIQTAKLVAKAYAHQGLFFPNIEQEPAFDEFDAFKVWEDYLPHLLNRHPGLQRDVQRINSDDQAFERIFSLILEEWLKGTCNKPDTPTWTSFKHRVTSGYKNLSSWGLQRKNVALFTSGGPIAVTMQLALDLTDLTTVQLSKTILNTSLSKFFLQDTPSPGQLSKNKAYQPKIRLLTFNQVAHLECKGNTKLLTYK